MSFLPTAFLLLDAVQVTASQAERAQTVNTVIMMVGLGVVMYLLAIRPQQKQRKEHQKLIAAIKTGDKVVTSSGIYGLISNVKETTVILKIADNVKIEIDKAAVATVITRSGDAVTEAPSS